jgi:hypothetical protein
MIRTGVLFCKPSSRWYYRGYKHGMDWTRSETLALAMHNCAQCHGAGLRLGRTGAVGPCNCVLRAIFRICHDRFLRCVMQERHLSRVSLEPHMGRSRPSTWGRKDEEYIADFTLISKRTLEGFEQNLFRYHFLLGADWKLCSRQLQMDRGNFFHAVYRIEQKLGRAFRELQPYPLYPLTEYFNGTSNCEPRNKPLIAQNPFAVIPLRLQFPMPLSA